MTHEEFNKLLDKLPKEDYIVTIASKHQLSDKWDIHNEILFFEVEGYADGPCFVWNDDWYEGQPYVNFMGITPINNISTMKLDNTTAEEYTRIFIHCRKYLEDLLIGELNNENN